MTTGLRRLDLEIPVAGGPLAAWLFLPDGDGPHPALVMAHGFGMTRRHRLDAFAERFAAAGIACVVFDYRGWGDSGGEPRQVADLADQRADWRTALAWARQRPELDRARIGLWGTSFSGGHVLEVAADDHEIAVVIAQVPFTDGPATVLGGRSSGSDERGGSTDREADRRADREADRRADREADREADRSTDREADRRADAGRRHGPTTRDTAGTDRPAGSRATPGRGALVRHFAVVAVTAVRDAIGARLGRPPRYIPITGPVGSGAMLPGPDAEWALGQLVPDGVPFRNEVAARIALQLPFDRPRTRAGDITCPLLVCVCDEDRVTPPEPARRAAADAPRGEVISYPFAHFAAYVGAGFEQIVADEITWLGRNLVAR